MDYLNLDITIMDGHFNSAEHIGSRGKDYPVTATFAKGQDASAIMQFPFNEQTLQDRLENVEQGLYHVQTGSRIALPEKGGKIQKFGQDLFQALFSGPIRSLYEKVKQGLNQKDEERLRIRLRIHPPELAVLPWELMYDHEAETSSYLCLDRLISLVRYQELRHPYNPLQVELPLYILGMTAVPKDQGSLDIKAEKDAIKKQLSPLSKSNSVKLNWLPGSSWDDLRKAMRRGSWHIFHFIGHGNFNASTNEGFITLADANGNSVPVNARDLSLLLDHPSLRLVILNSCKGAYGDSTDAFSSTASILARKNIPAIIAMQYKITDEASIKFAGAFYGALAKGEPIDAALFEARLALKGIPFSMEWAIPVLHMRSRDGNLFTLTSEPPATHSVSSSLDDKATISPTPTETEADRSSITTPDEAPTSVPQTLQSEKITQVLPPQEPETGADSPLPKPSESVPANGPSKPPVRLTLPGHTFSRRAYIVIASIIAFILILGGIFILPPLLSKPSPDLFPALCSGNFQSANTARVPMPATSTSPDGQLMGLSEGENVFDSNGPDAQYKLQATQDIKSNNTQDIAPSLQNALSIDQTDAEAQIYLENWNVLKTNHPHITLVVGTSFASNSEGASRGALQGAFITQKECNDQNRQDASKTLIVLMIANIGGNTSADRASSATIVANQIANQAAQDKTIVGIMAWTTSSDTINVNSQLKKANSSLPMISPSASSDDLGGVSHFFRVGSLNKEEAKLAANFLLKTKHKKRIAIIYDKTTAYSNNLEADFAPNINKDNTVGPASFTGGDSKTLLDALTSMLAQNPDAIYFSGYATDLFVLLQHIPSTPQTSNLLIVGGDALATTNSYPNPLPDLHNLYFTSFASPNQWDDMDQKPPFFKDYKTFFGTTTAPNGLSSIDTHALLGYDAMLTLLYASQQVLSTKNTITPSDLEASLKQITGPNAIQGITGRIAFDNYGNQDLSKMILVEHVDGTNLVIDEQHGCLLKNSCSS